MKKNKISKIYLVEFDAEFPTGIAAGAGSLGNQIQLARNVRGELILHGTAIAGVLRSQMRDSDFDTDVIFGAAHGSRTEDNESGTPSLLKVEDVVLKTNIAELNRVSHLRCRHTGSVTESALYSINAAPPKTTGHFRLWLDVPYTESERDAFRAEDFLQDLAGKIYPGILFGGNSNRGVGRAEVCGKIQYKCYDLFDKSGYAEYLDDSYAIRSGGTIDHKQDLEPSHETQNTLTVEWNFIIPPGEDLLVSDGKGLDADFEPHRITGADEQDYWLLPGSSLRGMFRDWCTRLASLDGKKTADNIDRFSNFGPAKGDDLGWMFQKDQKGNEDFLKEFDENWPIESMFGSLHKRGRLYISDGLSKIGANNKTMSYLAADDRFPVQYRMHVALDAISGAAVEGALFDNFVLTSGGGENAVNFPVKLILKNPREEEVRWLAQTLHAIHTGLLRVGSSKSAGRLAVEENSLNTAGSLSDLFISIASQPIPNEWVCAKSANEPAAKSEGGTSANLTVLTGKMEGSIDLKATYTDAGGKRQTIKIPKEIWGYRPGDAMSRPTIKLMFNGDTLVDVEIPGKPKKKGPAPVENTQSSSFPVPCRGAQIDTNKLPKGKASLLGMPFYNPYTFIPFAEKSSLRKPFTPQTADDAPQNNRFTGVLELKLETVSPLLTSEGWSQLAKNCAFTAEEYKASKDGHKHYKGLTIGSNVILPATGVRGFLRNLITIITAGPLTVLNEDTYLCQGRTVQISNHHTVHKKAILARVEEPGNSLSSGKIVIGETGLFLAKSIKDIDSFRPQKGKVSKVWGEYQDGKITRLSSNKDELKNPVQIKLSGQPVVPKQERNKPPKKFEKKEGYFIDRGCEPIELEPKYWQAYNSRHQFGTQPILQKGDLIWIESAENDVEWNQITKPEQIKSIQWARWGKEGVKIDKVFPTKQNIIPDSHKNDKMVSTVTDLFGQVAYRTDITAPSIKGRIRPGNLIFENAIQNLDRDIQIAVMSGPHLGCTPFYRNTTEPSMVKNEEANKLRGYKVYRNEKNLESKQKPWLYETQGVYNNFGQLDDKEQNVNFTADLLLPKVKGKVAIALRSLSAEEMGLLYLICKKAQYWRLGGGKPLSLGCCRVVQVRLTNETGSEVNLDDYKNVPPEWEERLIYWNKTQKPVETVRYPRATIRNAKKYSRGGMSWFQKLSTMKKGKTGGMQSIFIRDPDNGRIIEVSGQALPFVKIEPEKELLYGYDAFFCDFARPDDKKELRDLVQQRMEMNSNQKYYPAIEQFDEKKHITG